MEQVTEEGKRLGGLAAGIEVRLEKKEECWVRVGENWRSAERVKDKLLKEENKEREIVQGRL